MKHKPLVIGHRGAAGLAPENTLEAFTRAIELGVDGVELDAQVSADGEVVVHHDFALKPEIVRGSNGVWVDDNEGLLIKTLTLKQLKSYDLGRLKPGTEYGKRFPDQQPADGATIPLLSEVIGLFKEKAPSKLTLWIEIKTSPETPHLSSAPEVVADAVVGVVKAEEFVSRIKVLSFDWRALKRIHEIAPEISRVFSTEYKQFKSSPTDATLLWSAGIDPAKYECSPVRMINAAGGRNWAGEYRDISQDIVGEAHKRNMNVYTWTVDSKEEMIQLIQAGVDGIISNRPDRLISVMET